MVLWSWTCEKLELKRVVITWKIQSVLNRLTKKVGQTNWNSGSIRNLHSRIGAERAFADWSSENLNQIVLERLSKMHQEVTG